MNHLNLPELGLKFFTNVLLRYKLINLIFRIVLNKLCITVVVVKDSSEVIGAFELFFYLVIVFRFGLVLLVRRVKLSVDWQLVLFSDSLNKLFSLLLLYRGLVHLVEHRHLLPLLLHLVRLVLLCRCFFFKLQLALVHASCLWLRFCLLILLEFVVVVVERLLDVLVTPFEKLVDLQVPDCVVFCDRSEK
jgi:hypothetical protein